MNTLSITPYERRYREDVLSLMFYSHHTHTHFDWYKPGQWLDLETVNITLAFEGNHLIGVMGVSDALNGAAWMRLVAITHDYEPDKVLLPLWDGLRALLPGSGVQQVAVLAIHAWLQPFLPALGFQYVEDVVTMHRTTLPLPELPPHAVRLHTGYIEDLPDIVAIDHAAFAPPWQMSPYDLRMAQRESSSCTVAVVDHHAVGYEISTRHHYSGHLARLAVIPEMQGRGIGAILLHFLLGRLERRGMRGMTVNTQQSNLHSQHLYERFGFRRNGFDLPVWNCLLG